MKVIVRILIVYLANVGALVVASSAFDGVEIDPIWRAFTAAVVFGAFNWMLKPILRALSAPVIWLTLGIGLFLVNVLLVYIVSEVSTGFNVDTYNGAARTTLTLLVVNGALQAVFALSGRGDRDEGRTETVNGKARRSR